MSARPALNMVPDFKLRQLNRNWTSHGAVLCIMSGWNKIQSVTIDIVSSSYQNTFATTGPTWITLLQLQQVIREHKKYEWGHQVASFFIVFPKLYHNTSSVFPHSRSASASEKTHMNQCAVDILFAQSADSRDRRFLLRKDYYKPMHWLYWTKNVFFKKIPQFWASCASWCIVQIRIGHFSRRPNQINPFVS